MEPTPTAYLRKIQDSRLEAIENIITGTIYDDLLMRLQVRRQLCQAFFEQCVRPFRNKKESVKLLLRGTGAALRKLSDSIITSLGSRVWSNDRRWLLRPDELRPGQQPLQYVLPKARRLGDHEAFYLPLNQLWRRMRVAIIELKPSYRNTYSNATSSLASSSLPSTAITSLPHQTGAAALAYAIPLDARQEMWEANERDLQRNILLRKELLAD